MTKKLDVVLRSNYSSVTCLTKLAEQIDIDQWTFFSFSGYRGKKPILGRIEGNEFRLHKRRYWRNSFGPVLFGRVANDGRGALVEAYWDTWRWPRVFMRFWLGFAIVVGTPIFFASVRDAIREKSVTHDNLWLGFVVPLVLVLWGLLFPRLGAALSSYEKKDVVQLIEQTLQAGPVPLPNRDINWKTSVDGWFG
jgi:hypothetical protein